MIHFKCPQCGGVLDAPKSNSDEEINCPACGQHLQIPRLSSAPARNKTDLGAHVSPSSQQTRPDSSPVSPKIIPMRCPACSTAMQVPAASAWKQIRCPKCGATYHARVKKKESSPRTQSPAIPPQSTTPWAEPAAISNPPHLQASQSRTDEDEAEKQDGEAPPYTIDPPVREFSWFACLLGIFSLLFGLSSGLAAVGLGVCTSCCMGVGSALTLPVSLLGMVLGGIGILIPLATRRRGVGFPIAGTTVSLVSAVLGLLPFLGMGLVATQVGPPRGKTTQGLSGLQKKEPIDAIGEMGTAIKNIDKEIEKYLGTLARMATEVDAFANNLAQNRDRQSHLRTDISDMLKVLKNDAKIVVYRDKEYEAKDLTVRLELTVTKYNRLKEEVTSQEKILAEKKRTLTAAKERISAMKNEQEKLHALMDHLYTHLDAGKVGTVKALVNKIQAGLREIEKLIENKREFGRTDMTTLKTILGKSREEVLRAAKAALREDNVR